MAHARQLFGDFSIPQRLLLASAVVYGAVFAALLAAGRPGLGIGGGFYVAVILAGAATSAFPGALAGALAFFLYELGINDRTGLTWADFDHGSSLTRLAAFVAAGALTGFLAQRGRLMLAQSLYVLEDLIEIAQERIEDTSLHDEPSPRTPIR
jgi:hypothetical protein